MYNGVCQGTSTIYTRYLCQLLYMQIISGKPNYPVSTVHRPMLVKCWPTICDAGPKLNQHWVSASRLLTIAYRWISFVVTVYFDSNQQQQFI